MLALEQSTQKWPFSAGGGGRPTAPTPPPGYWPVIAFGAEKLVTVIGDTDQQTTAYLYRKWKDGIKYWQPTF